MALRLYVLVFTLVIFGFFYFPVFYFRFIFFISYFFFLIKQYKTFNFQEIQIEKREKTLKLSIEIKKIKKIIMK